MIVFDEDRCRKWAAQQLHVQFGPSSALGVEIKGELVAVCVYHNFNEASVELSFVTTTPRWASRYHIAALLWRYPFLQLGCKRVGVVIAAENKIARHFVERLGFIEEGYHVDALPTGDAVSYGLLRHDAEKWNV